jgi:hypothetical protein
MQIRLVTRIMKCKSVAIDYPKTDKNKLSEEKKASPINKLRK